MSGQPKDAMDAHHTAAERMYRQPLPKRPGEFYSWSPADEVIKQRGGELFAEAGMTSREQEQLQDEFRGIQKATGLSDTVLARLADGIVNSKLAEKRVSADPDTDDVELAQRMEANNALLREEFAGLYGRRDAEDLLERTRRFVRRHPALAKMLQTRDLGSDPEVVRGIAHHVFINGWRG